jgi:hypothetical protein
MAVTMKNAVFWDVMLCGCCKNIVFHCSMNRLLVTDNTPSSPILVSLMMEALCSSETSVLQEPHGIISQMTIFYQKK